MSTYLLLRNNKESGPYTIEEIKQLSLKSYDLVWVEGKSAAWRYPGEIPEFNAFAPPVPEQPFDRFYKKTSAGSASAEVKPVQQESVANTVLHSAPHSQDEMHAHADINPRRENKKEMETALSEAVVNKTRDAVYINLPAESKTPVFITELPPRKNIDLNWEEPQRNPEQLVAGVPPRKSNTKAWMIASIVLFFGAGLATGFYISNRRIFYTGNGNPVQQSPSPVKNTEHSVSAAEQQQTIIPPTADDKKLTSAAPVPANSPVQRTKKKAAVVAGEKKDSALAAAISAQAAAAADSARRKAEAESQSQALAAKIKAHPEEYLVITTGNYKVGMLGGLSEIPVSMTNRTGVPVDLAVVTINYVLHNKKVFKTETLSFHDLAPGSTATLEAPKSPRGVKITCRLTLANAHQIGMSYSGL